MIWTYTHSVLTVSQGRPRISCTSNIQGPLDRVKILDCLSGVEVNFHPHCQEVDDLDYIHSPSLSGAASCCILMGWQQQSKGRTDKLTLYGTYRKCVNCCSRNTDHETCRSCMTAYIHAVTGGITLTVLAGKGSWSKISRTNKAASTAILSPSYS